MSGSFIWCKCTVQRHALSRAAAALIVAVMTNAKRVLMIVSNPSKNILGWPVGLWGCELTHPYWEFTQTGYEVDIASPLGGKVPQAGAFQVLTKASESELREMTGGFIAYWGTFDVVESQRVVLHHVKGCLLPNWVGTDLRRGYEFSADGKRLTLIAETPTAVGRLVWEREAD